MSRRIFFVTALLIAASAQAQVHPDVVEVELLGRGCENVGKTIDVVVNGDEQNAFPISRIPGAPCSWSGRTSSLGSTDFFSVRLHGARTPVRRIVGFKNNQTVAWLQFPYAPASASDVSVDVRDTGDEWLPIGYVRQVRPGGPKDIGAPESGQLTMWTAHIVPDVNFDGEELRLRWAPMKLKEPGLRVNSILTKKKKHAAFNAVHLVDELQRQARRGDRRSGPSNSRASFEADRQMVQASKLNQLELTVP
jgi:hypothetical protein